MPAKLIRCRRLHLSVALAIIVAVLIFFLWPRGRITLANFEKIRVGMSQDELRDLLGSPSYEVLQSGLIEGGTYTINQSLSDAERRQRGFQQYRFQQWTSPEITIMVISDPDGPVRHHYSAGGQRVSWFRFVWRWL